MNLTGLLIGAGASYEIGMPLVKDLTSELKAWLTPEKLRALNKVWKDKQGGYSNAVIDDLSNMLLLDGQHYESILGHLETQFRRLSPLKHDYHGLYAWMVEMIYYILYFRHTNNVAYIQNNLGYFEGIVSLAEKNNPLWIFSLNHDLIIECVSAKYSITLNSGFTTETMTLPRRNKSGEIIGELRAEIIAGEQIENGAMPFLKSGSSGINLLKIHGALDVFAFNDGKDLLKLLPINPTLSGVIESLRIANEELLFLHPLQHGQPVKTTNEITYSDRTGEMQFLRRSLLAGAFKFDTRQSQVLPHNLLKHFRSNINHVTSLICIGYGFADIHINVIIREWLEFSAGRKLEIVAPGITAIPAFLLHLAPQIILTDLSATDYFDRTAGIIRTKRDTVLKKYTEWARSHGNDLTELQDFMKKHQEERTRELIKKINTLPLRDGDIDLESLGMSVDELFQKIRIEPMPIEDILERFLKNQETVS